jgi:hypothetical protein
MVQLLHRKLAVIEKWKQLISMNSVSDELVCRKCLIILIWCRNFNPSTIDHVPLWKISFDLGRQLLKYIIQVLK